jgi:uncharacterized protein (TIGR02588 family)
MSNRHPIEWTALGLSAAALLCLLALLIYDGVTRSGEPQLGIRLDAPVAQNGSWVVPVTVENEGGVAATNVDIEVELEGNGRRSTSTVTVTFAPGGSKVQAAAAFDTNPATGTLKPRILGYEIP